MKGENEKQRIFNLGEENNEGEKENENNEVEAQNKVEIKEKKEEKTENKMKEEPKIEEENKGIEINEEREKFEDQKEKKEIELKKEINKVKEIEKKINDINKKEEYSVDKNDNNKTTEKIKTLFESIKNFNQLKKEVYEIKKHYEYLNQLTVKNFEEKEQNNLANFNQKISEINKKFELLMGDIKPKDLENNSPEEQEYKAMNLSEINTRLRAYQFSKANTTDLSSLNEEFDFRIRELTRRFNEFKYSIFGSEKEDIEKEKDNEKDNNPESSDNIIGVNIPRLNFASKADFEKFKTKTEEEINNIWKEIDNIKLHVDDFNSKIKNKASLDELEELKDVILHKTEELFLSQNKKHVNYASAIKVLQDNFRKLLKLLSDKEQYYQNNQYNQYKMESNPMALGGHSCASCETYLGDLNPEQKFINWNKFPKKEKDNNADILKRVQNGYSRLLQMINFDNNGNPSLNPYTSSINNETNISSNLEDNTLATKEKSDGNQSFSNKRLFSTKVKKISKENNKTIDLLNSKKEYLNKNKRLPSIKTSKSIDNLNKLKYKSNQNINKKEINFLNPGFSKIINDSEEKNN